MKNKILSLGIIATLGIMLITLTACGKNSSITYSELTNVVRNATTNVGPTIGESFDNALSNAEWTETMRSTYITEVKVSGKDKESGEEIEIIWEVTSPGGDDHNYQLKSYTRNGTSKDVLSAGAYLRECAQKVKDAQN